MVYGLISERVDNNHDFFSNDWMDWFVESLHETFSGHSEYIFEFFRHVLGRILGSCQVQKSSWRLSECFVCIGSRFNHFDSPHFGGFCEAFRAGFANIFLTFLDVDFEAGFHLLVSWFFNEFHTLWTSKNEQIRWKVVQK